jgi:hypothetical protein
MPLDLSRWPRTLWKPEGPMQRERCLNCGQGYLYHGANEIVTRKCGFRVNQVQDLCRPRGDINPDRQVGLDEVKDYVESVIAVANKIERGDYRGE